MNDISPIVDELEKIKKTLSSRLHILIEYRKTRVAIKNGEELYSMSDAHREELGYLGSWKFNLTEVGIAGGVSVAIIKFFESLSLSAHQNIEKTKPTLSSFETILNTTWSWFEPFFIPLFLTFFVYMTAWSSLQRKDVNKESKAKARKAYLYFDGAHGLLPQTILPILLAFIASDFIQEVLKLEPVGALAITIQLLIISMLIWQLNISGNIIPKKLFTVNQYTNRTRRFWQKN